MAARLTRVPSLKERLDETLAAQRNDILNFLSRYNQTYLLDSEMLLGFISPGFFWWGGDYEVGFRPSFVDYEISSIFCFVCTIVF